VRRVALVIVALLGLVGVGAAIVVSSEPEWYLRARYPLRYEIDIREQGRRYDIDPALVAAVIYRESKFKPGARSDAGAIGLMQLTPQTATAIAQRRAGTGTQAVGHAFTVEDLETPAVNIRYGTNYLRYLMDKYDGRVRLVLAAYNAGETRVDQWRREGRTDPVPLAETRRYVERVLETRDIYRRAYDLR
jgi:soluble lytic murein transglycosylase